MDTCPKCNAKYTLIEDKYGIECMECGWYQDYGDIESLDIGKGSWYNDDLD